MSALKLRNIGPKSAAWLRQVGLRSAEDLAAVGAVGAFVKVRRAGFKPSLNLLYSLEGALVGCHWQEVPDARRQQLVSEYEAAAGGLPATRAGQMAGPVHETHMQPHAAADDGDDEVGEIRFSED
ncbi:MAG: TfoX/Sxy family protein [Stenotrophomonas sp.]|uniref:TfoX/Sxy family protein n=1 Tax=Stenotrophomonas TaxID=40323 RepID=UPI001354BB94|nr:MULTISPECIES: TfoX/Sxy family protein [Stenotrophomonas]MCH1910258.1 TfoX/Sxy family protein [Stenotrophomonas sp. Y6]MPS36150.1 transcriptional regulator [Stenotrophomonas sp.]MTI74224.1 TfoX/Sxy family protein [Stenotrophomonas sp.]